MYTHDSVVCVEGSLQAPETSKTSSVGAKFCSQSPEGSSATVPASSAVELLSLSSCSGSNSSTSSQGSDDMKVTRPQPPPALCPTQLPKPAQSLQPRLPHFLLVEGEMSPVEESSVTQDVASVLSMSSGARSDKTGELPDEGTPGAVQVGSDVSSEPLTFHTDFGDDCNTVASLDEAQKNLEALIAEISQPQSKLVDVNENFGEKNSAGSRRYGVEDLKSALACERRNGLTDQQKLITELCNGSQYLPVSTSTVVVNMVVSSVVTQPEDQNSTAVEPSAAVDHSQQNSECDVSASDEASTHNAPAVVASNITEDRTSTEQEKSSVASPKHGNDANRSDDADHVSSAETRSRKKRSKSPASEKSKLRSKGGKRDRSRSSERRSLRSRSRERKRNRSRSGDRSGKQSVSRSSDHSPQRENNRQKDRKRSRSSSRSRRRRSSSREHQSRSRQTSSHSSRRRERSSSRSHDSRKRNRSRSRDNRKRRSRSRSQSKDLRRQNLSADQGKRRRRTRSRSKDSTRQSTGSGHRKSTDEDAEVKDDSSVRQADRGAASKNPTSERSHDSPRKNELYEHSHDSPRSDTDAAKTDESSWPEKSVNSSAEKVISTRQSNSDLSSAVSGRQEKSDKENAVDNNRIAVISSSTGPNRRLRHMELKPDEEPPAAYDPSEPTEDNFRDDRKVPDRRQMPPRWVPPANQRMPMVYMPGPPPPGFPTRLPPPPSARFLPARPLEGIALPPHHFGVNPSDGGRPPPPPPMNMPLPLPRPPEVQARPMMPQPPPPPSVQPVRLPPGMNVDTLFVRGPMDPTRLFFVPPGVGQPVRLGETPSLVGLPRIICPPTQVSMADLVRLPLAPPQPRPGTLLTGPPFVSGNQMMIHPAPVVFQQVPEHGMEPSQAAPPVISSLPMTQILRVSADNQPLMSNMPEMPFPPGSGQPAPPKMPVPPAPLSQPPSVPLSSSSASSPSSGSPDAEDLLLERYSAKPVPPQCLFPSQKPPDPPKPAVDVQLKSPDDMSEESEKSSDHLPSPQPPPVPALRPTVITSSEAVPTSTSDPIPSDPRLLVQFLLKQTRQSAVVSDGSVAAAAEQTALVKPSPPPALRVSSENSPDITESPPENASKNKTAYSPSQADYLGEEDVIPPSDNVREIKVCFVLLLLLLLLLATVTDAVFVLDC